MGLGGEGKKSYNRINKQKEGLTSWENKRKEGQNQTRSVGGSNHTRSLLTDWEMERDVLKHSETAAVSFQGCSHSQRLRQWAGGRSKPGRACPARCKLEH